MDCIPPIKENFAEKGQLGRFWKFFKKKGRIERRITRILRKQEGRAPCYVRKGREGVEARNRPGAAAVWFDWVGLALSTAEPMQRPATSGCAGLPLASCQMANVYSVEKLKKKTVFKNPPVRRHGTVKTSKV